MPIITDENIGGLADSFTNLVSSLFDKDPVSVPQSTSTIQTINPAGTASANSVMGWVIGIAVIIALIIALIAIFKMSK